MFGGDLRVAADVAGTPRTELRRALAPRVTADPLRQNKHHRWSLDESQVGQYHLDGVLHPHIRWWEATDAPRKAIQFVECADLVLVALVCKDLAQNDDVAHLIRSVGPSLVLVALLDGRSSTPAGRPATRASWPTIPAPPC
jgi:hypothetical protein